MVVILIALSGSVTAGEGVCLNDAGRISCVDRALPHVAQKAVVLEFIDPSNTGYGEAASRLMWRETLTAIRNMRGRGVLLATRSGDTAPQRENWDELLREFGMDPVQILQGSFHPGALRLGKALDGQMVAWGGVVKSDTRVALHSFLSVIPEVWKPILEIKVPLASDPTAPALARLPVEIDRLAFAPVIAEPDVLFGSPVSARCNLDAGCPNGVPIKSAPEEQARLPTGPVEGTPLKIIGARGKWLNVELPAGERVWMNFYHAEFGPIAVTIPPDRPVMLRNAPGTLQGGQLQTQGPHRVESVRRTSGVLWYQISSEHRSGWVKEDEVEPVHRLPAVHFLAGLYRYGAAQYPRAEREFRAFLHGETSRGDPVTHAMALQLIALSRLKQDVKPPGASPEEALSEALKLTPFNPTLYSMRAAIRLTEEPKSLPAALNDVTHALSLYPDHPAARAFAGSLAASAERRPQALRADGIDPTAILEAAEAFPPPGSLPR
ncbi:hypothetical protein ABMY26_06180 [Azospirillum sp. HJ39]|uniref:hypothetical protein n=1 Tax=Azospirillum sp. HJ39 TaxID=3159496 RepID=UPI003557033D